MNASEEQQLKRFLSGLVNTPAPIVDQQAMDLIQQAFARQPHAAYLLTQRSLALCLAIEAAQQRISQLEAQSAASTPPNTPQAWPDQQAARAQLGAHPWGRHQPSSANLAQVRAPASPAVYAARGPQAQTQSSWSQGLMGSLVGAAAGVMIGQALWQGVEHLMSSGDGPGASAAALTEATSIDTPIQQAQSDWSSGLSYDQGSIDEGAGDDWF